MMSDPSVAIVTGGAQGLGAAICGALLEQGYKVCVADIQESTGRHFVKELQREYGSESIIFSYCDVTKEDDIERTFDITLKAFGNVSLLINNAGILLERDPRKVIEVNLIGTINGCQKALKYMGKTNGGRGGAVVNTASLAGLKPMYQVPAYAASKHGIVGLTRSFGHPYHFDKEGILFMAICPHAIDTDMVRNTRGKTIIQDPDFSDKIRLSPEDVAKGVLKLLEDGINGSTLFISKNGYDYIDYKKEFADSPLKDRI